ncbi:MAG TPA: class I SAM-dependent methyltransferase [Burkholderiaceae bacterium]|nr:class I SAM-dependent methyltransferase [Rhodoferax sp.]HQZ06445.1 class I SAM-dependent methyltransferase [Burkholderiaceae bacterium]
MQPHLSAETPFKTTMRAQWDHAAAGWNAHTADIRAWLSRPTEAMCRMAGVAPGARVLDVAAGAGEQTMVIACMVGPQGHVFATDLSPAIVALARANMDNAGFGQVETRVADGEHLGVAESSFDAAVCRLGLMFFPDPLQGLRELHRALRPGGGACTMVFSRPDRNPCVTILMSTALKHAGLPAGDPFQPGGLLSLGQPGRIDGLFRSAGFQDVATTAIDAVFHMRSADHYLEFIRSSASPIQGILGRLSPADAAAAWAEMRDRLDVYTTSDGWAGPNELLLTAGRRGDTH